MLDRQARTGWPIISGDETQEGMQPPFVHSGGDTWAVIGAGRNQIDLIESGLTVFGDEQLTLSIPCQTLRIAMAKGIHERALKRIVFGNATGKRQAENFSGETLEILRALVIFGPPRRDIEMVVRTDGDAAAIV